MPDIVVYQDNLTLGNKLRRLWWNFCCLILFRPFTGPLFKGWRNMILRIFGAKISHGCNVYSSCKIWAPWNLELGPYSCLGPHSNIYSVDKITIGYSVTVSQGAYLCTASHDINYLSRPLVTKAIIIEPYTWICADAFVGMGVTIGKGAVVGARAAVFKNVAPWTVVGGNPAKFIKNRVVKDGHQNA